MKFIYILLIIIFAGPKLSASAQLPDTSKILSNLDQFKVEPLTSPIVHQDSLRVLKTSTHNESIKLFASANSSYGIKLFASFAFLENNKISDSAITDSHFYNLPTPDSLKAILRINHADSVRLLANQRMSDSLKLIQIAHVDSVKQQLKSMDLDALKDELKSNKIESLKGPIYFEIASRYMNYDTIGNKKLRSTWQNDALSYTMLALHQYSMYNDTPGLRGSFDNLATVYFAQKKFSQAKWFILQSNTLSRVKNDVPNIITSLLTLSAIKSEISDYSLAMRDLNEAMQLSITNHYPKTELIVLTKYALLYSRLKNYPKEELALKKRDSLQESIKKDEEAKLMVSINTQALAQKKKNDQLQNKKKVYTSNIRKLSKNNSSKKIALL